MISNDVKCIHITAGRMPSLDRVGPCPIGKSLRLKLGFLATSQIDKAYARDVTRDNKRGKNRG